MLSQQSEIVIEAFNKNFDNKNQTNQMSLEGEFSERCQMEENALSQNNCTKNSTEIKTNSQSQLNTQYKLKKLQQLYNNGLQRLKILNTQNHSKFQQKSLLKSQLQAEITKISNQQVVETSGTKTRKGSQTSTAGQEQEIRTKTDESQDNFVSECNTGLSGSKLLQSAANTQFSKELQKKLQTIRKQSLKAKVKQQQRIHELKAQIQKVNFHQNAPQKSLQKTQTQNFEQKSSQINQLKHRLQLHEQQRLNVTLIKEDLEQKILESKRSIIHFSNSAEYLRSTQNCCQEILNEELCSLQYKIQGKRLEYDSNKRYLDKVIRTRKYEDNVSFQDIKNQINYLNDLCEQMIDRKNNFLAPDIKKYKHKRLQIMEQIKELKDSFVILENKKKLLDLQTKDQNKIYDQLQDEYCALLEKVDEKGLLKHQEISSEEKIKQLKERKFFLQQDLKDIVSKIQSIKTQLDSDTSLVPSNILKELRKKTQKKKQEIRESELLTKQNLHIDKENKILNQEKEKLEWKSKPELQHLNRQEKQCKAAISILEDSLKTLKENNDLIQEKLKKMEEEEKIRKQEALKEQVLEKQDFKNEVQTKEQQKQKPSIIQEPKRIQNKGKKSSRQRKGSEKGDSKQDFFVMRENPFDDLMRDFPVNRSQETSNISLLQSNPALYMLLIYFTVVIPGLCIGYAL